MTPGGRGLLLVFMVPSTGKKKIPGTDTKICIPSCDSVREQFANKDIPQFVCIFIRLTRIFLTQKKTYFSCARSVADLGFHAEERGAKILFCKSR